MTGTHASTLGTRIGRFFGRNGPLALALATVAAGVAIYVFFGTTYEVSANGHRDCRRLEPGELGTSANPNCSFEGTATERGIDPLLAIPLALSSAGAVGWALARRSEASERRGTIGPVLATAFVLLLGWATLLVVGGVNPSDTNHFVEVHEGRPLRRRRRSRARGLARRPRTTTSRSRSAVPMHPSGSADRDAAASPAVAEADSVTAFAELAARLSNVGAPATLVRRCYDAAEDEARHALVASLVEHRRTSASLCCPRPVAKVDPRRPMRLGTPREVVRLAIESRIDGELGEGAAAARIHARASAVADPLVAVALGHIADDEDRHATLASDVIAWCRTRHPRLVSAALAALDRRLP